jgi:IS5 family transposase
MGRSPPTQARARLQGAVATDQEAGLIRGVEVTTTNVHDAAELGAILPDAPGDTYGDSAYAGSKSEAAIRAHGGTPRVVHTGTWAARKPSHD